MVFPLCVIEEAEIVEEAGKFGILFSKFFFMNI